MTNEVLDTNERKKNQQIGSGSKCDVLININYQNGHDSMLMMAMLVLVKKKSTVARSSHHYVCI